MSAQGDCRRQKGAELYRLQRWISHRWGDGCAVANPVVRRIGGIINLGASRLNVPCLRVRGGFSSLMYFCNTYGRCSIWIRSTFGSTISFQYIIYFAPVYLSRTLIFCRCRHPSTTSDRVLNSIVFQLHPLGHALLHCFLRSWSSCIL